MNRTLFLKNPLYLGDIKTEKASKKFSLYLEFWLGGITNYFDGFGGLRLQSPQVLGAFVLPVDKYSCTRTLISVKFRFNW